MDAAGTHAVTLNGLKILFDDSSGAILKMEYLGPGTLLFAEEGEAGLVDAAYPVPDFEPLRLAARHSSGATVSVEGDQVVVRIPRMGPSRPNFEVQGDVAAMVTLQADPDGRSIILSCEIQNRSDRPVRQVIFPELRGLIATAGQNETILKSCGFGSAPFRELVVPDADQWYAVNSSTIEHKSGGMFHDMWARWLDLGGLNGGFSVFPRRWGWDPQTVTVAQLRQSDGRLRLQWVHAEEVEPGATWSSGEWVLTPHRSGWAKGIEPYREWVRGHVKRRYAMPDHIREGLGFRTVWMCQGQPNDPTDAVWRFRDLPDLAREARDHGLTEMVLWAVQPGFDASLPGPFAHLGTEQDFIDAVKACRALDVNVAPFISVLQASPKTAERYGLKVLDNNGWTYHTEMIPRWNPPYASGLSCVQVGPANQQWQDEVAESCRRWADKGIPSVSWDQYWSGPETPMIQDLTQRIRDHARQVDPQSSFSGEELWQIEVDCEWLDYTWNWGVYGDRQAFVNAFPAPRPNANINRSLSEAKFAFMDNLFLNVWPSRPDGINGSERINAVPDLSKTLRQCAALRKQFLKYFTEGTLIGACLMPKTAPGVRLSSYVLPDRALAIVLNQGQEAELSFKYDLAPWIPGKGAFTLRRFDQAGTLLGTEEASAADTLRTAPLAPLDMEVFEFEAK